MNQHHKLEDQIASVLQRQAQVVDTLARSSVPTTPGLVGRTNNRRPRTYGVLAAAALVAVISGGLWALRPGQLGPTDLVATHESAIPTTGEPSDKTPDTTADKAPAVPWGDEPASASDAYLAIGETDWEIAYFSSTKQQALFDASNEPNLQLFRPPGGTMGGSTLVAMTTSDPWSPISESLELENIASQRDEGDRIVYIYKPGQGGMKGANGVLVEYPERTVTLAGVDVEHELVVAAADSLTMDPDGNPIVIPPDGLEPVLLPSPHEGPRLSREVVFVDPLQTVEAAVRIWSGTRRDIEWTALGRSLTETGVYRTRDVGVAGVPALVSYNNGHEPDRVFVVGGRNFVIEMDITMPEGSTDADLDALLATARWVDDTEFLALAPKGTIVGSNSSEAIAEIVADIPLPPGFNTDDVTAEGDRYQAGTGVSSAVMCAWIEEWIEAKQDGDNERIAEAAAAMATSHQWAILVELADQGGWSQHVWEYADAVNGDGTVIGGQVLTVEESYQDALCI